MRSTVDALIALQGPYQQLTIVPPILPGLRETMIMPILTAPTLSPLYQALLGGTLLVGVLGVLQKAFEWIASRRDNATTKIQENNAAIEVARIQRAAEESKEAREEARRLLAERKEQVAELKADGLALRRDLGEEISALKLEMKEESEQRKLVKLSAEAAHIRSDEMAAKLEFAKTDRDELMQKLAAVESQAASAERHSAALEKEKNIEIELISQQLEKANRKISELEAYIREHKLTVRLTQGDQTITASMDPMDLPTLDTNF